MCRKTTLHLFPTLCVKSFEMQECFIVRTKKFVTTFLQVSVGDSVCAGKIYEEHHTTFVTVSVAFNRF